MKLLVDSTRDMVSKYPVLGFQSVIGASGQAQVVPNRLLPLGRLLNRIFLVAYRELGPRRHLPLFPLRAQQGFFSISVGPYFAKCLPYFLGADNNSLYLMDAWPQLHDLIEFFVGQLNIRTVFLSSKQATEAFSRRLQQVKSLWLPEAINPQFYHSCPLEERDIDVLQFGRKYDQYHHLILDPLETSGRTYLYEKVKGQLIFGTRDDFVSGLSRMKVSICFPANITHPDRAGDISTMTTRYLQSMAAKCLVVGMTPSDMRSLFDYDPVIPANMDDPYGQLDDILRHFGDYVPLIENNYEAVWNHHTWAHRWEQVQKALV